MSATAAPVPRSRVPRPLEWAIGASLLLHLFALMLPQPLSTRAMRATAPLHVRLWHVEPAREPVRLEAPPATMAAAPARAVAAQPKPARPDRHVAPNALPPVLAGHSDGAAVAQPGTATPSADAERSAATTPATTEAAQAAEPDPQALANFGRAFSTLLTARQQYPRLAAMRGWEGEVRLRVHIAMKGNIVSILLVQSSGFELLDRAAIKLVEACDQLPPLPPALRGHDFDILVPVQYRLARAG